MVGNSDNRKMQILPTVQFPYGLVVGDEVVAWARPDGQSLFNGEIRGEVTAIFRDTDEAPAVRVEYDTQDEGHMVFDLGLDHPMKLLERHDGLRPGICDSFGVYNPKGELVHIHHRPKTAQESSNDHLWAELTNAWIRDAADERQTQFNPMETASKAFAEGYRIWPVKIAACRFPSV